jgi:PHD/YefM family antitoxin component YafN of YafNO toxin-antitoxin module
MEHNDMTAIIEQNFAWSVTSKEAIRHWKEITDKALREPVVITAYGRPRHVLLAYEDYERLRDQEHHAHLTAKLRANLAYAVLEDVDKLRVPSEAMDDGDTITG